MGKRTETNYLIIHCSTIRANQNITFEDIKRWHTMERAFIDIGYHWVIERYGSVKQGRPADDWGAKGHNHESVGICLVGGLDNNNQPEDNFTPLQKRMLKLLIAGHQALYPDLEVRGHSHFDELPGISSGAPAVQGKAAGSWTLSWVAAVPLVEKVAKTWKQGGL